MPQHVELYEREFEMDTCAEALDAAVAGHGSCVILQGGAGTGKSALLQEVANGARARGMTELRFRGSHAEHDLAFNLAAYLVQSVLADQGVDIEDILDENTSTEVATAIKNRQIDVNLPESRRWHILRDLTGVLSRAMTGTPPTPVLFAIDNLHWADSFSLRWLAAVLDRLHSWPMAVVATVCDGLRGTDAELLDDVIVEADHHLTLTNLGPDATRTVLRGKLNQDPQPDFTNTALQVTGGNPLLLDALVRAIDEREITPDSEGADLLRTLATDSLALSLRVRLRRISPEAIAIFRIAAVLDGDATVQNIADLSGLQHSEVAENCYAMRKLGVLATNDAKISVAQPLMANSVLRDSPPTALRAVHAESAVLLHRLGASHRRVAAHLLLGGSTPNTPWAPDTLRTAAEESITEGDHATAIRYLWRALDEPLPDDTRAALLTEIATAMARSDVEEAARIVRQAINLSPDAVGNKVTEDLLTTLAVGKYQDEVRQIHQAAQETRAASIAPGLLFLQYYSPDGSWAGLPPSTNEGAAASVSLMFRSLDITHGAHSREKAIALADQASARRGYSVAQLVAQLGAAKVMSFAGDVDAALRLSTTVLSVAESRGLRPVLAMALLVRSRAELQLGRVEAAAESGRRALALARDVGFRAGGHVLTRAIAHMVTVLAECGLVDEAFTLLDDSTQLPVEAGTGNPELLRAGGRLRVRTGDLRAGLQDLLACGEILTARGIVNPAEGAWRSQAALALVRLGEREEARRLIDQELELARGWGAPGPVAEALRVRAKLADSSESAVPLLAEAVDVLRLSQERLSLPQALFDHGCALAELDPAAARKSLRESYELAMECGLDALSSDSQRELLALGGRAPRTRSSGIDSLTDSERRVAVLAAQGRKNREIAAALFVQTRTVEIHLTNAYRKLGIEGRSALGEVFPPTIAST
ncbi:ATP-binding protein [Streptomyces fagopyri]|uniref:ATP-binding protein n=1 Tax=Streptomyces fagopyri TaxID=2662397 RepID=UPI00371C163A